MAVKKRRVKKKSACPTKGSKRKFNGKNYTLLQTSSKKSNAQAKAKKVRTAGGSARVVKNKCGYAVYTK